MPPPLHLNDTTYAQLVDATEKIARRLLVTDHYDSITNFIALYDAYAQICPRITVSELFKRFEPVYNPHANTCVGLALKLMRRWQCLENQFPGLGAATGMLSCEESAKKITRDTYMTQGPYQLVTPDKEHVMVGVQILLNGRRGVLIGDPGYHVAKIVTVMLDRQKPHTGWFAQVRRGINYKNFNYTFCRHNSNYIIWREEDLRKKEKRISVSLIYASRPYYDGICVTEKRNTVYKLKSLVARTHTGAAVAGVSFILCPYFGRAEFVIIYSKQRAENDKAQYFKEKLYFKDFEEGVEMDEHALTHINICNQQLNYSEGRLLALIQRLANVVSDIMFVRQCMDLNAYIVRCSAEQREYLWSLMPEPVKANYKRDTETDSV